MKSIRVTPRWALTITVAGLVLASLAGAAVTFGRLAAEAGAAPPAARAASTPAAPGITPAEAAATPTQLLVTPAPTTAPAVTNAPAGPVATGAGPAAELLYTAPKAIEALAIDQAENAYVVTSGGVLKIGPDGAAAQLASGLKACGFSLPAIAALPGGGVVANDCVGDKDTLVKIDSGGIKATLATLQENVMSLAADASGQVYVGSWTSEGNLDVHLNPSYLTGAVHMAGHIARLQPDGTLKAIYEGGIPLALAASPAGELYAAVWGKAGPFEAENGDYQLCTGRELFWVTLGAQVEIIQLTPGQTAQPITAQLSPASALSAGQAGTLYAMGLPKGGRCDIYRIEPEHTLRPLSFAAYYAENNITGLAASAKYLYFADLDGHLYRIALDRLVAGEELAQVLATLARAATATLPPPPAATAAPPTLAPSATPEAAAATRIKVGGYVKIANTGGIGLVLRSGPGTGYARVMLAAEDAILEVTDGPSPDDRGETSANGDVYQWWYLRSADGKEGWGRADFLAPAAPPPAPSAEPTLAATPTPRPGAPGGSTYTVQPGDTLEAIANRFGTDVAALLAANGLSVTDLVYIGQVLVIPGGTPPPGPSATASS